MLKEKRNSANTKILQKEQNVINVKTLAIIIARLFIIVLAMSNKTYLRNLQVYIM